MHIPNPDRSASPATYAGCWFKIICAETSPDKFLNGDLKGKKALNKEKIF
jgi:hypothetical protein